MKGGNGFVVHLGDFKPGNHSPCKNKLYKDHLDWLKSVRAPVFYTPGDNDWTDCDRGTNDPSQSSLERLEYVRHTYFDPNDRPHTPPASWNAIWQQEMPENAAWTVGDIAFATIHVVGGNNGRKDGENCSRTNPATCDKKGALISAANFRDRHNLNWIKALFARSIEQGSKAVIIATQADMTDIDFTSECTTAEPVQCDGFKKMKLAIAEEAKNYKKPVLLLHGDSSPYCLEKQMSDVPNLWRLNAAGDYRLLDAVIVKIDTSSNSPFTFEGVQSKLEPADCSIL